MPMPTPFNLIGARTRQRIGQLRPRMLGRMLGEEYIVTPELHGWRDDGKWTDRRANLWNTACFQAAIEDAHANHQEAFDQGMFGGWGLGAGNLRGDPCRGLRLAHAGGRGVVQLTPGKTYTVDVSGNGSSQDTPAAALTLLNDVEVRTANSPVIGGNQAKVQWPSWSGYTTTGSLTYRVLFKIFSSVDNVALISLDIDGRRNTLGNRLVINRAAGGDGGIHNISVRFGASNLYLKNVYSHHALCDGISHNCATIATGLVEDCVFSDNCRQAMTLVSSNGNGNTSAAVDSLIFRRVAFNKTGDHPDNSLPGCQPGWGIDIEPSPSGTQLIGVSLYDCDFVENWGSAYLQNSGPGTMTEGDGFKIDSRYNITRFRFEDCRMTNNRGRPAVIGFRDTPTFNDFIMRDCTATGNTTNDLSISGTAGTDGGRMTNGLIDAFNSPTIRFRDFPSPWNSGWSLTINSRGNGQSVVFESSASGMSTVTHNP